MNSPEKSPNYYFFFFKSLWCFAKDGSISFLLTFMSFQNCITFFVEHKHLRKWTVIVWTIWYCMVIKKRDNFQIIFFYVSQKTFVEICGWVEIFFWWTIPLRLSTLKYWKRFKFERQIRYANILFQSCRKTNWGGKNKLMGLIQYLFASSAFLAYHSSTPSYEWIFQLFSLFTFFQNSKDHIYSDRALLLMGCTFKNVFSKKLYLFREELL